jgi:hypothetical protein
MEKRFVALKNEMTVRVQETKFERSIGDSMIIDGVPFKVIATGSRNECVQACNVIVAKFNAEIAEINRINLKKMSEVAKTINNILNDIRL